jgi:hypothetical protein
VIPDGYYAVPDPDEPGAMTYWRARGGRTQPWPAKAWYGPARPLRRDVPTDRDKRSAFISAWNLRYFAWHDRLLAALTADLDGARARFAVFQIRCCSCGRALRDAKSKTFGIGPECRRGESEAVLASVLTPLVAKAHAEALGLREARP